MNSTTDEQRWLSEGYRAFHAGETPYANPYSPETESYQIWMEGYHQAMEEPCTL